VSAATLAAIAATLSACGNGELTAAEKLLAAGNTSKSTPTPTPTPTATGTPTVGANQFGVTIANYPALANVGGIAVVRSSPAIALARTSGGFVAFSLRCPHQGTTVRVLSNRTLQCPNHGATFAYTGGWTGGYRTGNLSQRGVTASTDLSFAVVNLS
jgi:Rieske Fe-S protein